MQRRRPIDPGGRRWPGAAGACALPCVLLLVVGLLGGVRPARAESAPGLLRALSTARRDGLEVIEIELAQPLRVRSHAPHGAAREHEISLVPVVLGTGDALDRDVAWALRPAPTSGSRLEEAVLRREPGPDLVLSLRFAAPVRIEVAPGAGFRSLRVSVDAATPAGLGRGAVLLSEARKALALDELPRAAALLTKVLDHPEQADLRTLQDAQELLALTRERSGQLAHARAEYLAYLEHHPEGDAAERVRQRLAALDTALADAPVPLRAPRPEPSGGLRPELFGSVSAGYARYQDVLLDGALFDSSAITDLLVNARAAPGRLLVESEAAASYRADLMADRSDEAHVSTLFVAVEDPALSLLGIVGRQRPRGGGVLGRVDGAELRGPLWGGADWRVVAGLPVESTSDAELELGRQVFALALESPQLPAGLEAELFSAVQRADGLLDRAAVGAELRLVQAGRHVLAFADYDLLFRELNTALVTGSQDVGLDTQLSALLELRRTPILTLRSALQGQVEETLEELSLRFDENELRSLARDRTARLWSATAGGTHRLHDDLQLGLDARVSSLSGTPASGGVPGTESTGLDVGADLRVTLSRLLSRSDVHTLTLGARASDLFRDGRLALVSRQPIGRALRLAPRLQLVYRDSTTAAPDSLALHPALGVELRWRNLRLDALAGAEYVHRLSGPDSDELAMLGELILRLDF